MSSSATLPSTMHPGPIGPEFALAGSAVRAMQNRRFLVFLVFSLLLHAILVGTLAGPDRKRPSPTLLRATLKMPAPTPAPSPAEPAPTAATPVPRDATPTRPATPRPAMTPVIAEAPSASPPPLPATLPATVSAATPETRPSPLATPAAESPRPQVVSRPRPDIAGLVADYSRVVSGLVGSHRQYPGIARIRGWQGTTLLEVRVDPDGRILGARIAKSSGHEILDRQAEEMLRRAEPLPPVPSAIRDEVVLLQLPILFALVN